MFYRNRFIASLLAVSLVASTGSMLSFAAETVPSEEGMESAESVAEESQEEDIKQENEIAEEEAPVAPAEENPVQSDGALQEETEGSSDPAEQADGQPAEEVGEGEGSVEENAEQPAEQDIEQQLDENAVEGDADEADVDGLQDDEAVSDEIQEAEEEPASSSDDSDKSEAEAPIEEKPSVAAGTAAAETVSDAAQEPKEITMTIPAVMNEIPLDLGDSDALFADYANRQFYGAPARKNLLRSSKNVGSRLTGQNLAIYTVMKQAISEIAAGQRDSAEIHVPLTALGMDPAKEYTASEIGLDYIYDGTENKWNSNTNTAMMSLFDYDFSTIVDYLRADCPYEMYWGQAVREATELDIGLTAKYENGAYVGYAYFPEGSYLTFTIEVESKYRPDGGGEYDVDTAKTGAASSAAAYAKEIVNSTAGMTDLEKLTHYKEKICNLVIYDENARQNSATLEDRGPWALIYVFDQDNSTNVVCEGYSEAFQYLCDLTDFDDDSICAYSVTGTMSGGTGSGGHKWNIVHMEDGYNYIADITNSDDGTWGSEDELFLKGMEGSVSGGYSKSYPERVVETDTTITTYPAKSIAYTYDSDTTSIFTEEELTLSAQDYGQNAPVEPVFRSKSLILSGQLGMNFFMDLSGLTTEEKKGSYMTFTVGKSEEEQTDVYDQNKTSENGMYYAFTCYVNSIQMADTIHAVYHYTSGGAQKTVEYEYSVAEYLDYFDNHSSDYTSDTLNLIHSIADYGHYAQLYLSPLRKWTIGNDYADMAKHYQETFNYEEIKQQTQQFAVVKNLVSSDVEKVAQALYLDSETAICLYVKPAEGYTGDVTATSNRPGYPELPIEKLSDGRYRIRINDISALWYDDTYDVRIMTDNGESVVTVSVLSYVNAALSLENAGTELKNIVAALYQYWGMAETINNSVIN